ncbi:hypothetical protein HG535_0C01900 [Zygotorulaspora mrakii]|uniref:Phosphoribulokinase/uridine kinase domain-containing protein n=1 Tax=Zygotorulaspora mrakii TaxID=42260 RepID=A0A7H9AZQ4_ZYGMR|nr:uncharacterized protein HG535_0C01900 [Zygotorulaspora mrakii]QLG71841.1 hypothetical protein HG535_0C01900 [Zygotorulaspora mrakii]
MPGHIRRVIVAIGGGHATGVMEAGLQIKKSLNKLFPSTTVTIIDLDSKATTPIRTYTNKDYDFDQVYEGLVNTECLGDTAPSDDSSHDSLELVLLCGCYALFDPKINSLTHLKVFLDSDGDTRLINLIKLNKISDGDQLAVLIAEYMEHLRVEMQKYIAPTRANADLIIPCSNDLTGYAIITDGIVKIMEDIRGNGDSSNAASKLFPLLVDFEAERMDVQKERYYDLS